MVTLLDGWHAQYGVKTEISESFSKWTRRYLDENGQLSPFEDNDPKQSWEICNAKYCLQMHEGKLWKCPILAYLPMVKQKLGLSKKWDHALSYRALEANCSDAELAEFLARKDESYCAACPAFKRPFPKNDPTKMPKRATRTPDAAVPAA